MAMEATTAASHRIVRNRSWRGARSDEGLINVG